MSSGATTPIAAWKLPLIVAGLAFTIVGGFYVGGAGVGLAMGGLCAAAIVVMAVRRPPVYPIEPPLPTEFRRHVLIVLDAPLDEAAVLGRLGSPTASVQTTLRIVAPAPHGRLARWTSDLEPGREAARRELVLAAASLAKGGFAAGARVSDEEVVQTVDDELRSFPATEVLLVATPGERTGAAVTELEARLTVPLRQVPGVRNPGRETPNCDENSRRGTRAPVHS